jgi:hypothetical protein
MSESNNGLPTAPYASWTTFSNFLGLLAEKGVPGIIDRSVMTKMSGATQSNLRVTLTFLNLVDCDGHATDTLRDLAAKHGTPQWKATWRDVISTAYAPMIGDLPLKTGTANQLAERFRENGGVRGSTLTRAVRFYLAGLRAADIDHSPYFKPPQRTRRPRKKPTTEASTETAVTPSVQERSKGQRRPDATADQGGKGDLRRERRSAEWRTHSFHLPSYEAPIEVKAPLRISRREWELVSLFMTGTIDLATATTSPSDDPEDEA